MRQLTSKERKIARVAYKEFIAVAWVQDANPAKEGFEAGFTAALDYQQAELAALQAENQRLREALKPFAECATLVFIEPKIRTLPVEAEYLVAARAALDNPNT